MIEQDSFISSAYFSDGNEIEVFDSRFQKSQSQAIPTPLLDISQGIRFPVTQSILWDRSGILPPKFIKSLDVIPSLVLLPEDIQYLVSFFEFQKGKNIEIQACLKHISELPPKHSSAYEYCPFRKGSFILAFNLSDKGKNTFTIPISSKVEPPLLFETISTNNIKLNLHKAIKSSKTFSLKNFFRFRASGLSLPNRSNLGESTLSKGCKFHIETFLPDISLQYVAIQTIPILSTPFCLNLFPNQNSSEEFHEESRPTMGFVTLNQTRKVVFLLETDPVIQMIPTVGVWVRLDSSWSDENKIQDALYHPFCWSAAVKFLLSDNIPKKNFIDNDTFLMILILGQHVQFFEVTAIYTSLSIPNSKSDKISQSNFCRFIGLDYNSDLIVGNEIGDPENDSIIGRFKLSSSLSDRIPESSKEFNKLKIKSLPLKEHHSIVSQPSPLSDNVFQSQENRILNQESAKLTESKEDFLSFLAPPKPLNTSPGCFSNIIKIAKAEEATSLYSCEGSIPPQPSTLPTSPMTPSSSLANIIVAQQRQIESLQNQVENLTRLISKLNNKPIASLDKELNLSETNGQEECNHNSTYKNEIIKKLDEIKSRDNAEKELEKTIDSIVSRFSLISEDTIIPPTENTQSDYNDHSVDDLYLQDISENPEDLAITIQAQNFLRKEFEPFADTEIDRTKKDQSNSNIILTSHNDTLLKPPSATSLSITQDSKSPLITNMPSSAVRFNASRRCLNMELPSTIGQNESERSNQNI